MDKDFKKFLKGKSHIIVICLKSRKIRELSRLPKNYGAYKLSSLLRLLTDKALWYLAIPLPGEWPAFYCDGDDRMGQKSGLKKSQDQKLNLKLKKQLNQIVATSFWKSCKYT